MIEIRGDKKVLITPISEEDLADIKIGDIVWLDGDLMTCRDVAHRRLVEYGRELPYDIKDKAIFHAGPIVRKIEGTEDDYEMVSVGPTLKETFHKSRMSSGYQNTRSLRGILDFKNIHLYSLCRLEGFPFHLFILT